MAKRVILPSQAYLQACFDYDPKEGILRWKARPVTHFNDGRRHPASVNCRRWNTKFAGKIAGYVTKHTNGAEPYHFHLVGIDKQMYVASRIIWKLMTGNDPENIDHKNCNSLDNRFENLRECTVSQNGANVPGHRKPTFAGLKGVTQNRNKFKADITVRGKHYYLGAFDTAQEAHEAYCKAAKLHFGEFARAGKEHN